MVQCQLLDVYEQPACLGQVLLKVKYLTFCILMRLIFLRTYHLSTNHVGTISYTCKYQVNIQVIMGHESHQNIFLGQISQLIPLRTLTFLLEQKLMQDNTVWQHRIPWKV